MFYISLWISKLYYLFQKNKKSDKVGLLALTLDKSFLKHIKKPKLVIAVTGTNGKTTTCNFLSDILQKNGYKVTCNKEGANLKPGICKALMKGVTLFNNSKVDVAILEFDELSTKLILPYLKPNYVIVTNLSSDTMKRNGHTDYVFSKINEGIPKDTTLILNADDLISSQLEGNKKIYFGISKLATDTTTNTSLLQDIRVCPQCYSKLNYNYIRYHHIGHAECLKCGFTNPTPDYNLTNIDYLNKSIMINNKRYPLINDSIFNVYNQLVAITLLEELKIPNLNEKLNSLKVIESRYSNEKINNIEIITQLAKGQNAIACSRAFEYISKLPGNKEIILILDDIYDRKSKHHSEVTSWIYDTDFEYLKDEKIKRIIIGGKRAYDYKIRLLFAGIESNKIYIQDNEIETYKDLEIKKTDKIIIIHDIYMIKTCKKIISKIKEDINENRSII